MKENEDQQELIRVVVDYNGNQYDSSEDLESLLKQDFARSFFNIIQNHYSTHADTLNARGVYFYLDADTKRPTEYEVIGISDKEFEELIQNKRKSPDNNEAS